MSLGPASRVTPIVCHHALQSWRDMASDKQRQYIDAAEEERHDRLRCMASKQMRLIVKLATLRTSLTHRETSADLPLYLNQCSLIMCDLLRFDRMFWGPGFTVSSATSLIPDGGFKIMAPKASSIAVLQEISNHTPTHTKPTWINNIVYNRASYSTSMFKVTDHPIGYSETINYYVLSHASQNP